ncbi:MAG: family transporter substrate-binding protein [Clostridiales bacterium]|jgi:basic membrane protein A|nr:family transporter substrate-binding protein [Clostridiales bacterium]
MKKFNKIITLLLIAAMVLSMAACKKEKSNYEIALITDVGTIDDKSFNQGAWEGVVEYAKENKITHKYYKPTEKSDDAYLASFDLAVKNGAKIIVCPGFLFEVPVFKAQTTYPDVKFIILDGAPHAGDWNPVINDNVLSIFYAEQEAGFLAGYAAVKDGYRQLGFTGGIAVPAVIRFGYGFIQGADLAAQELGLSAGEVNVKYTYFGNFDATPDNMAKAAAWYNEGTELIFACGGASGNSVMKAAETAGTKVIGVDVDQYNESDTVITSSMKNLGKSVVDALTSIYDKTFEGGKSITLDAAVEGVQLPMKNSRFETFTQADYDSIYSRVVNKDFDIKGDQDVTSAAELATDLVTVTVIE